MAGRGRIRLGLAGVGLAALCVPGRAEPAPAFPAALDRAGLVAWLRQETDITPAQVVAVSASAVTAVLGTIQTPDPKVLKVALRAEAIDPQVSAREAVLSWHVLVEVDCAAHRLRPGPTTGYAARNLLGEGREIRPGAEAWSEPPPGAQFESVWRAACEPAFRRPLTDAPIPSLVRTATPAAAAVAPALRPMLIQDPPALAPPAARRPTAPPNPAPQAAPAPTLLRAMAVTTAPEGPRSTAAVQLGAMATPAAAEAMLAGLRTRFTGALHGLSTGVTPANVGGRTVYRALVSGFSRRVDANQFCLGLQAGGVACFVR